MQMRLLVCLLLCLGSSCNKSDSDPPDARTQRSNLIVISIDTLRADHLGCYGYERPTSPSIDAFSKEGALFETAYSTSPWTKPSHASMFTGLYPSRNGATGFLYPLSHKVPHIAELLAQDGYQTAAIVGNIQLTWHGLERGFEHLEHLSRPDNQDAPTPIVDRAISWIKERDRTLPFFAFIHSNDVHSKYRSLPKYSKEFVRPYSGIADGTAHQLFGHMMGLMKLDSKDSGHLIDLYDSAIRQLDDELSRLFAFFQTEGLLENSTIIFTADHGEEFLEHGGVTHGFTQFEESVRIPLILRGPDVPKGMRFSFPASLVDILPTSFRALGIDTPIVDGVDLATAWSDSKAEHSRRLYLEANCRIPKPGSDLLERGDHRAILEGRYKLYLKTESNESILYDLNRDPHERIDFGSANRREAQALRESLNAFIDQGLPDNSATTPTREQLEELRRLGYADPRKSGSVDDEVQKTPDK